MATERLNGANVPLIAHDLWQRYSSFDRFTAEREALRAMEHITHLFVYAHPRPSPRVMRAEKKANEAVTCKNVF